MYKNILKLSVILLFVSLLFSFGCKKKIYDIRGEWDFEIIMYDGNVISTTYGFSGSIESGNVYYNNENLGTYTVNGDIVNFTVSYYDEEDDYNVETFSGFFDNENSMSGDFTLHIEGYGSFSGTWTAE